MTFETLIEEAESRLKEERYLLAAEKLRQIPEDHRSGEHHRVIAMADAAIEVRDTLLEPHLEDTGWHKQAEIHGNRDTIIHYKINDTDYSMTARIETPIEESLLIPLISVFNESELYKDWMPRWEKPVALGMQESIKMAEMGRGHQITRVRLSMPYPMANRECIMHTFAVDSIDQDNAIIVKIKSIGEGEYDQGRVIIGPEEKDHVRVTMEAGLLIRVLPDDHPIMLKSKHKYPEGERILLVSLMQSANAHVKFIPIGWINFFTRTVYASLWGSLIQVAEDIRSGKRPHHQEAIDSKEELYDWITERVQVMFQK